MYLLETVNLLHDIPRDILDFMFLLPLPILLIIHFGLFCLYLIKAGLLVTE